MSLLSFCNSDLAEDRTASFAYWYATAVHTGTKHLLETAKTDGEIPEAWGPTPDMIKRRGSKVASPVQGYTHPTAERGQLVTEIFTAFETGVTELPNTVDGMGAIGFSKDLLETYLKVKATSTEDMQ